MAEVRLVKFRFKPDGQKKWLGWSAELKRRSDEVFQTLRDERVVVEACFLSPEENAVYYFVAAENLEQAEKTWRRSPHVIDREHMQAKSAALEQGVPLECLFFFDNR